MKKFIDFSLKLDNGEISKNFKEKYNEYFNRFKVLPNNEQEFLNEFLYSLFDEVDIRTQEKLISKAKLLHDITCVNKRLNPALLCFELMWIVLSYKTKENKNEKIIKEINYVYRFN